jgi:hypothetical protein
MAQIEIKFLNQPAILVAVDDTSTGRCYYELCHSNYLREPPMYRDRLKYTTEYMTHLADRAQQALGWHWDADTYGTDITAILHKDLERLLGQTGFDQVAQEHDELLHELHYCLHIIQFPVTVNTRQGNLQIEWFNDDGFDLPDDFEFSKTLQPGTLLLQNPHVGHGPIQMYRENDWTDVWSTCRFQDRVKPGIVISNSLPEQVNYKYILGLYEQHAPDFVRHHGRDKILHYTGHPVIGHVQDLELYQRVMSTDTVLELQEVCFHD